MLLGKPLLTFAMLVESYHDLLGSSSGFILRDSSMKIFQKQLALSHCTVLSSGPIFLFAHLTMLSNCCESMKDGRRMTGKQDGHYTSRASS